MRTTYLLGTNMNDTCYFEVGDKDRNRCCGSIRRCLMPSARPSLELGSFCGGPCFVEIWTGATGSCS